MANITNYNAIFDSKNKIDYMFEEMTNGLRDSKQIVEQLAEDSWSGDSYDAFENNFQEILDNINKVKTQFLEEIDTRLKLWYEEFNEAEKQSIRESGKLVG